MSSTAQVPTPVRAPASAPARSGIALMVLAFLFFGLTNVGIKWLGTRYPMPEILFARSLTALLCLGPFLHRADIAAARRRGRGWLHLTRMVISAVEIRCFFAAAALLPLADAVTLYLAGPIYVTALSALLLGESVGWRRWCAVTVGFGGVLVAFAPSFAKSAAFGGHPDGAVLTGLAFAVAGSMLFALVAITTRELRATPGHLLAALQILAVLIGMGALADASWRMPPLMDLWWFVLMGVGSLLGYLAYNRALSVAAASVVAPFQYTSMIWATLLGFMFLGEIPTGATLAGGGVIIGAGLFILWRERARGVPASV